MLHRKQFTDREKTIARIWKVMQSLVSPAEPPQARTSATVKLRKGELQTVRQTQIVLLSGSASAVFRRRSPVNTFAVVIN
jgi:hypothetical protein